MNKTKYYRLSPTEYLVDNGNRWDVYIIINKNEVRYENASYMTEIQKALNAKLFREFNYCIREFDFEL